MRCWIAMAWSSAADACGVVHRERALSLGQKPNELWCTDYKGEFLLGNRQYCYPLTVTDHASRYLLLCEALSSTREDFAFTVFERFLKSAACPPTSAAITACLSLPRMLCST